MTKKNKFFLLTFFLIFQNVIESNGMENQEKNSNIEKRTSAVRKQIEIHSYLNRCLKKNYDTLGQAIEQLSLEENKEIFDEKDILEFKKINDEANKAKHIWNEGERTQEDFEKMEKKYLEDLKSGNHWSQVKLDYWEISQKHRDQANEEFRKENPQFFQDDDYEY